MKNVYYNINNYANFIRDYRIANDSIEVEYIDAVPDVYPYSEELENELKKRMINESLIWLSNYSDLSHRIKFENSVKNFSEAVLCSILMEAMKMTSSSVAVRKTSTAFASICIIISAIYVYDIICIQSEAKEIKKHRLYNSIHSVLEKISNDDELKKQFNDTVNKLDINTLNNYSLSKVKKVEKELISSGLFKKEETTNVRKRKNELN